MPDDELSLATHWQMARELNREVDDIRTGTFDVGDAVDAGKRRREVMAATIGIDDLDSHLEILKGAGLTPIVVEPEASALARVFRDLDEGSSEVFVVGLGRDASLLMLVRDGVPRFIRSIPVGTLHIVNRAAEQLALDESKHDVLWAKINGDETGIESHVTVSLMGDSDIEDAICNACAIVARELAHEVVRCVHYLSDVIQDSIEPSMGCVVGGGRLEGMFVDEMRPASGIEFKRLDAILSPTIKGWLNQLSGNGPCDRWLLPLGSALHDADVVPLNRGINHGNLLLDPLDSQRRNGGLPSSRRLLLGSVAAVGLVWVIAAYAHLRHLDVNITHVGRTIEQLRGSSPEADRLEAEHRNLTNQVRSTESLRNAVSITAVLSMLTQVLPEDMVLKSIRIDAPALIAPPEPVGNRQKTGRVEPPKSTRMDIHGLTTDDAAIAKMVSAMGAAGFRDVWITESRETSIENRQLHHFQISVNLPELDGVRFVSVGEPATP